MTNFPSDLECFLVDDEFAETATVNGEEVPIIFDRAYLEQEGGAVSYQGADPFVIGRTIDFEGVGQGDLIVARSTNYAVVTVEFDGTGLSTVQLRLA